MSTESELRKHRCCFTGHRPEKLERSEAEITALLESAIRAAVDDGFVTFLSGMARGVDIWAAEIVLRLRDEGEPVRLICASPFAGFEANWPRDWQERYHSILKSADLVKFICPSYSRSCFRQRNEWMVEHAARVIAVFNGARGGTKSTIDYAAARGVPVVEGPTITVTGHIS